MRWCIEISETEIVEVIAIFNGEGEVSDPASAIFAAVRFSDGFHGTTPVNADTLHWIH